MDKTVVGLNVATRSCIVYPDKCWFAVLCRFWLQCNRTLRPRGYWDRQWCLTTELKSVTLKQTNLEICDVSKVVISVFSASPEQFEYYKFVNIHSCRQVFMCHQTSDTRGGEMDTFIARYIN